MNIVMLSQMYQSLSAASSAVVLRVDVEAQRLGALAAAGVVGQSSQSEGPAPPYESGGDQRTSPSTNLAGIEGAPQTETVAKRVVKKSKSKNGGEVFPLPIPRPSDFANIKIRAESRKDGKLAGSGREKPVSTLRARKRQTSLPPNPKPVVAQKRRTGPRSDPLGDKFDLLKTAYGLYWELHRYGMDVLRHEHEPSFQSEPPFEPTYYHWTQLAMRIEANPLRDPMVSRLQYDCEDDSVDSD